MPTYDYKCDGCGHEFELFQSMTASVKRKCPECGTLKLKRLIGIGAAVLFKGGGFYETDYRTDSYKKGADAEKKAREPKKKDDAAKSKSGDGEKSTKSSVSTPKPDAASKKAKKNEE